VRIGGLDRSSHLRQAKPTLPFVVFRYGALIPAYGQSRTRRTTARSVLVYSRRMAVNRGCSQWHQVRIVYGSRAGRLVVRVAFARLAELQRMIVADINERDS